jgi:hypothetical protein
MICFSARRAESSGSSSDGCALRPMSPPVWGHNSNLFLLLNVFFQGAVFGAGLNVVPGNVNVIPPVHVARMPCSSWPRKGAPVVYYYTGHSIRRLWTANLTCAIDRRRLRLPRRFRQASHVPQPPPGRTLSRVSTHHLIVFSPIGID